MLRLIFGFSLFLFAVVSFSFGGTYAMVPAVLAAEIKSTAFEKNLRKTLEENPEIILNLLKQYNQDVLKIVVDASQVDAEGALQQYKQLWENEKANKAHVLVEKNRPYWGNEKASVVIVAYSDFLCPYCAVSAEYMKKFLSETSHVRYIFKNFSKNPLSQKAYTYLLSIWEKDKEKAGLFMYTVFSSMDIFAKEKEAFLDRLVTSLGLNVENIRKRSTGFSKIIEEDLKEGQMLEIKGTPTLMVNGKYSIIGAVPEEILREVTIFAMENK
ncbi:MAG: thioredoxin domain-containing protein [Desulfovibrionaceae bacterium]